MRKHRKDEILKYILLAGGVLGLSMIAPKLPYEILKQYLKEQEFQQRRLRNDIDHLKRRGLILKEKGKKGLILRLTSEGARQAIFSQALDPIMPSPKWNKKWHLLVFDIPEKNRNKRKRITEILQAVGCIQVQQSVYVSPYYFRDKISIIAQYYRLEACFFYFEVSDQPAFEIFRSYFFNK